MENTDAKKLLRLLQFRSPENISERLARSITGGNVFIPKHSISLLRAWEADQHHL